MEKRIKGRTGNWLRYNPDSAKLCGQWNEQKLYRKQSGEYFLCEDDEILPLKYEEAKRWAQKHLDNYDALFGEIKKTSKRQGIYFSLPASSIEKLKRASSMMDRTQSDILTELIEKNL